MRIQENHVQGYSGVPSAWIVVQGECNQTCVNCWSAAGNVKERADPHSAQLYPLCMHLTYGPNFCLKMHFYYATFVFYLQKQYLWIAYLYVSERNSKGFNRIKVVLAELQRTNRWLAEPLDKSEATILKWCTNRAQPSLKTLVEMAKVLHAAPKGLLCSIK